MRLLEDPWVYMMISYDRTLGALCFKHRIIIPTADEENVAPSHLGGPKQCSAPPSAA